MRLAIRAASRGRPSARVLAGRQERKVVCPESSEGAPTARGRFAATREETAPRRLRASSDLREIRTCIPPTRAVQPYPGARGLGDIYRRAASHRRKDRNK